MRPLVLSAAALLTACSQEVDPDPRLLLGPLTVDREFSSEQRADILAAVDLWRRATGGRFAPEVRFAEVSCGQPFALEAVHSEGCNIGQEVLDGAQQERPQRVLGAAHPLQHWISVVTWLEGDAFRNNVAHELMFGAVKLGLKISVGCPKGYEPNPLIFKSAVREAQKLGSPLPEVTADPRQAVAGADVVYTDVWTSMGQEDEAESRRADFRPFAVTPQTMAQAGPDALFMHCLPAHRGEEVAAEVIDGPQSVVFDQAENRLHVQKAVMVTLMGQGSED